MIAVYAFDRSLADAEIAARLIGQAARIDHRGPRLHRLQPVSVMLGPGVSGPFAPTRRELGGVTSIPGPLEACHGYGYRSAQ